MKIYTKLGDDGQTGLVGGARVGKDDARIEAYGTVDELSATLGFAIAELRDADQVEHAHLLREIQRQLFVVGAELASHTPDLVPVAATDARATSMLEAAIDRVDGTLPALKNFILPGGTRSAAALHVARTVCRRAERRVVGLSTLADVNPQIVPYLNRLSDLLFVMSRSANAAAKVSDIEWQSADSHDG